MQEPAWWINAVIYEFYVDKFAGDLKNLTAKLDYLSYLGVTVLWLLPHYPSPMVDGGYDISDYQNIRSDLGTMEDFDEFLVAAHQKGLKVMLDMVLNHTSDQHPWFRQHKDWYMWSHDQSKYSQAFVHFKETKGSNWIWDPQNGEYYYATFYKQQPDLNWDNPEVVMAMQSNIDFWLQKGVDGLRLDAISRLIKRDGTYCFGLPETHQILKNIRTHIDAKFPGVILLAESGGWPDEARQFFGSGDECHLVMHFPLSVRMLSAIPNRDLAKITDLWSWTNPAPAGCSWAAFLTSHDSVDAFFLGSEDEKQEFLHRIDPNRVFSSPDGQSVAARLGEVCKGNKGDMIWATQTHLSQPAIPIIYYGNEIGMRNLSLPERPADFRGYVRGQFDWNEAEAQMSDPDSVLNSVRAAIAHHKNPAA